VLKKQSSLVALVAVASLSGCGDPLGWYGYALEQLAGSTDTKSPWAPSSYARGVHARAPAVIDMHADTLVVHPEDSYLDRLLVNTGRDGHVDVPRLIRGNVALQVFSAYTKGSVDTLGNTLSELTGKYVDDAGVEHTRYDYVRDPDIAEYDDPRDPYRAHYEPWGLPRDVATYGFRASRDSADVSVPNYCETWYDDGNWNEDGWGPLRPCPGFDRDDMYVARLRDVARRLHTAAARDTRIKEIRTRTELDALVQRHASRPAEVGALLSTEGLYFRSSVATPQAEQKLRARFDALYATGFRMFALTHFIDNDHGGAATGMGRAVFGNDGRPLSAAGRLFAELTLTKSAVLDVAHASGATIQALTQLAYAKQKPIVYSHGGLQSSPQTENAECATSRNLTDAQVRAIAATGGVVGLGFAEEFVCGTKPIAWARAVRRAVDLIDGRVGCPANQTYCPLRLYQKANERVLSGVDHVGLGSDYDGGIHAYTDIANLEQYTEALVCTKTWLTPNCLENPFSEAEAHKILGGNVLRVLRANLPL
jgi:microsomal dipeptidase-like Zn-dependent dipeptidase